MMNWIPVYVRRAIVFGVALTSWPLMAQDDIDELLEVASSYVADRGFKAIQDLEKAVAAAANASREERLKMEQRLLKALEKAPARDARILLCRLLKRVATNASIPAMTKLIGRAEDGHMARAVLVSIPTDAALAAMREQLPQVSEELQIGLINSLTQRGDQKALPLLVERLTADSPALVIAAIRGIGLLGTREAVEALESYRQDAKVLDRYRDVDDALLQAAEGLLARGDRNSAREIYVRFAGASIPAQRLAGLNGLAKINDLHARQWIEKALEDGDASVSQSALRLMIRLGGDRASAIVVDLLPKRPPTQQIVLLDWMASHGDSGSLQAVAPFLETEDLELQAAAVRTLCAVGSARIVPALLARSSHDDARVRDAARQSLMRLQGSDVDRALIGALGANQEEVSPDLISLVAARGSREAFPALLTLGRDAKEKDLREAALKALGSLASEDELPALASLLVDPEMSQATRSVEQAIRSAYRQIADPEDRAGPLLAVYREAPEAVRPSIINLLGPTGSAKALSQVRESLTDSQSAVRNAAVHTLARWPSPAPIDDLYQIAKTSEESGHRVVALRGFVAMARSLEDAPARYGQAMELAQSPEDKKLVLSGLARTDSIETLELCQAQLQDEDVATEAALACIQISRRTWRKNIDEVEALLTKLKTFPDDTVQKEAQRALERIVR